jgi:cytosine/adenosine deaminase-related metal-dependent hydrolase
LGRREFPADCCSCDQRLNKSLPLINADDAGLQNQQFPHAAGTTVIDVDGIIFPGLIDLHDHLTWNIFPRWRLPRPVGNRYDWQALPEYAAQLSGPEYALIAKNLGCEME